MGFNVGKALGVKRVVAQVNNTVVKAVDRGVGTNLSGQNSGGAIAKSDIGKAAGAMVESVPKFAGAVIKGTGQLLTGDVKGLESSAKVGVGELANIVGFGIPKGVAQSDALNGTLRNENTKKWTLGLSENYAGYASATNDLSYGRDPSATDIRLTYQGALKAGAIGFGASAIRGAGGAEAAATKSTAWLKANKGYVAGAALFTKGKGGQVVGSVAEEYVPGSGDEVGNWFDNLVGSNPANPGASDGSRSPAGSFVDTVSNYGPIIKLVLLLIALIAGYFMFFKRKKGKK